MADTEERKHKSKWRNRLFSNDQGGNSSKGMERPQVAQMDDDVMDFLKPSSGKSQPPLTPPRAPRIDVAAAPRWPAASDLHPGSSPGLQSSMRGREHRPGRKAHLLVSFVKTDPEIIGEGGDECDEPAIEVAARREYAKKPPAVATQDDTVLGLRSPLNQDREAWEQAASGDSVRRSKTSATPSALRYSQRIGSDLAAALEPPPRGVLELEHAAGRSPLSRARTDPVKAEDDDFRPPVLRRAQTGFSPLQHHTRDAPGLPEGPDNESPIMAHDELQKFLGNDEPDSQSYSSRIQSKSKMRAEEGRALQEAATQRRLSEAEGKNNSRPSTSGSGGQVPSMTRKVTPKEAYTSASSQLPAVNSVIQSQTKSADFSGRSSPPLSSLPSQPPGDQAAPLFRNAVPLVQAPPKPKHATEAVDIKPVRLPTLRNDQEAAIYSSPMPSPALPSPRQEPPAPNETALEDFAQRVTHMQGILRLTAELAGPLFDFEPKQWLRVALWWFYKGRMGLETLMRDRSRPEGGQPQLTQPHVDLAKAWWILYEVLPSHPRVRKYGEGNFRSQLAVATERSDHLTAEIYDIAEAIAANLRGVMSSMARNDIMPPQSSLIQGQDQTVWVTYPQFAPDVQAVLSGHTTSKSLTVESSTDQINNPLKLMPLSDTMHDYCFGRMFVQISLSTEDANTDRVAIPALLTIMRPPVDFQMKLSICSQNDVVNVCVSGNPKLGPTWNDVSFKTRTRGMYINLPRGFTMSVDFTEKDFRMLWNIQDYTRKVESSLFERKNERLVYEVPIAEVQYTDTGKPPAFPLERIKRCRARVFEHFVIRSEGTGQRRFHRGYRLLLVTSPKNKTLGSVSHEFGSADAMGFDFRGDTLNGEPAPALVLRFKEPGTGRRSSMNLVFSDPGDRNALYCSLNGMAVTSDETPMATLPLKSMTVVASDEAEGSTKSGQTGLGRLRWQDVRVINFTPKSAVSADHPKTVLSDSLRLIARHSGGSVTDRLNLSPGELSIRLDASGSPEIHMLRTTQEDMNVSIDMKRIEQGMPEVLEDIMGTVKVAPTIRSFAFANLHDLHTFQAAISGFSVKYDGVASTFAIARRRMVVPIYKKWEATTVRVQVVQSEPVVQLLAFFEGYSHADAISFQLKSTDVFEKFDKGDKIGVKFEDAKFPLPPEREKGRPPEVEKRFVCLDMPEYPAEHDDITISFDSEAERDLFLQALPAATQVSRGITIRRRI